jgi:hypothetical protein
MLLTSFAAITSVACGRTPTAPTLAAAPPLPAVEVPPTQQANVSGTVWLHDATRPRPLPGATVDAWVYTARWGGGLDHPAVTDANGRYLLWAPVDSRLRMHARDATHQAQYQPCAATVSVTGDVTQDVHLVGDRARLGARLPELLLAQSPTLSGAVFEVTSQGRGLLGDVRMDLVTDDGGEIGMASTLTDADGRYVLCGLGRDRSAYLYASKSGYVLAGKHVVLSGPATTLDFELQNALSGFPVGPSS